METTQKIYKQIRRSLSVFIVLLILSGITAFPIETELEMLVKWSASFPIGLKEWIDQVYFGVKETNLKFPFMAYGSDWLAFAHIVIAVFFIGPLKDPVRNSWVIKAGMISCLSVFVLAFTAGPIRSIPFWWQLIDSSFGLFGFLLLGSIHLKIKKLELLLQKK